jgi:DNA polymerase-3 subunit alpha
MTTPKHFVNLHGHDTFSVGDGIGMPQDHIDYAVKNGADALAQTNHGNMNGFSYQYLHAKKLKDKGIPFKALSGVEAYYIPSLSEWRKLKTEQDEAKAAEKEAKRLAANPDNIGDELASAKAELEEMAGVVKTDEDEMGGTVVENEEDSKSNKYRDPIQRRNHLVLLAKNNAGLKTLFRLVSNSYIDGFYKYPRIDLDMLKREAKGNIIALSACVAGADMHIIASHQTEPDYNKWGPNNVNFELIQSELKDMIYAFKDALGEENYYLEMQFNRLGAQHLKNFHIMEAAKRTNTNLVVTCDSHYSNPDHWRERELYKAMAWASKSKDGVDVSKLPQKVEELKCELYPKNAEQLWDSYKSYAAGYDCYNDDVVRSAIERTWDIAHNQIGTVDFDRSVKLPVIEKLVPKTHLEDAIEKLGEGTDEDVLAFEELKRLAKIGLKNRKRDKDGEYIDRLVYELGVIKELKFAKYFLTYAKIMDIASKQMMIGNARGSAGGSLLSYALGITQVDPIRFGLLFERFLVRKKKGFPDIDSDFGDREKAVKLIGDYFGTENVISVSNFNQLQLRSLIKDVARLAGLPFDEINKYTGKIENEALAEAKKVPGFDRAGWVLTYEEAENNSASFRELMEKYPDFEKTIRVLFKQMRNVSRHAGGVIITSNPRDNMPIIKSGDVLQTPWPEGLNARHLEDFGLLKFDILGLGTLRMFEECIRKILRKTMPNRKYITFDMIKKWFDDNLHPDVNALDDMKVYKNVYWDSRYAGIFQFVQQNVQKFMAEMKPKNVTDIAIATSIFRPGPLGIGADKLYLNNRKNPSKIAYKHPLLEEVLADTSGLIVFQEQLQLIYHKLAGVPLEDTDAVRKAFTKKDLSNKEKAAKEREAMREDFANRCLATNNIAKEISYSIFDEMEKFVAYSFNKSHAVAYAITSYQCAWFLTYYPEEWITTYIDYCATEKGKQAGKEDPKAIALSEAKALGFTIGKPDVNLSEKEYTIRDGKLIPSFASLKHVGMTVLNEINEFRPYNTLEDLLFNPNDTWRHSKFNKRALATLIKLEAFESMGLVGEGKMFKNYRQLHHVLVDKGDDLKRAVNKKKKTHKEDLARIIAEAQELPDWDLKEKVEFSRALSGTVDIDLIVTPEISEYFRTSGITSIDDWEDDEQWVWCIVKNAREAKTKTGKAYMRMKIYGASCTDMEVFVWNFKSGKDKIIPENSLILGRFKKSDFGLSSFFGTLEIISK